MEIFYSNIKRVEDFSVDSVFVEVDEVYFFLDLLYGGFRIEGSYVGVDVIMGVGSDLFEVNIIGKFYVFGVDMKDFKLISGVRDIDVNFLVEFIELMKGRINRVGLISGCYYNDVRLCF